MTPSVLAWARKTAHLQPEDAAAKIKRPVDEILAWERGELQPSLPQARKAAEVYRRPLAVFFLPGPPRRMSVPKFTDFRKLPSDMPAEFSYELAFLIRQTRDKQEWLRETLIESEEAPLSFIKSRSEDANPKVVAQEVRNLLGFNESVRSGWKGRDAALSHWVDLVEQVGVYVFQRSGIDVLEARGFALVDAYAPFIFLNSKDARSARIFTLIHEFVHLLVGESGVSNLGLIRRSTTRTQRIEVFCNAVAGEVIAAEDEIEHAWQETDPNGTIKVRVVDLSVFFKVSPTVVLRRLLNIGIISATTYDRLSAEFDREWRDAKRDQRALKKKVIIPRARQVITQNGRAFCRAVVSVYRSGEISPRDLSDLLNIKLNHLPKLISTLTDDGRARQWRRPA